MSEPYFSLIVPVYNTEAFLPRCVQSVLAQDFADYELILVDDGSTDSCPALCDTYASQEARVRVVHKINGGVSSARNYGIRMARGKWIWFIDSDDYILPHSLTELYRSQHGRVAQLYLFNQEQTASYSGMMDGFLTSYYFKHKLSFCPWDKLYLRQIVEAGGLWFDEAETIGEDMLFNLKYYSHISSFMFLKRDFYVYDIREGSAMTTPSSEWHINHMRLFNKVQGQLNKYISQFNMQMLYFQNLYCGIDRSTMAGLSRKERLKLVRFYRPNFPGSSYQYQKALVCYLSTLRLSFKSRISMWFLFSALF